MDTVWVTKWALSDGVTEEIVRKPPPMNPNFVRIRPTGAFFDNFLELGKDVFADRDAALADAEERRKKRIASLRKRIEKIERMTIKVKPLAKD